MLIKKRTAGFTIVELLIVIVVIGVLAAIVIVAYNGTTRRAQTSSLQIDVEAMDKAQKTYMVLNDSPPLTYDSNGNLNDLLVFAANKGNSIVVKLKGTNQYCVYGYNPASDYPTPATALIRSSDNTSCDALDNSTPASQNGVYSTVSIIGQRIEAFKAQNGYYPHTTDLASIGLVIKPNNGNANQQQLYCRNNTKAIYLQIDQTNNVVYVYETASHSITQPAGDPGKLSLNSICPQYGISPTDPGYESTGVKDPNIT